MYVCPVDGIICADSMADMKIPADNVPTEHAPVVVPPTRTDDQILPSSKWVPFGKSNSVLDVQKSQRNPIFSIDVSILKNTNFFKAFTTSSMIPAIYIQQFWDTMCFNSSTGLYSCQLYEQWFNLHKDILKDTLDITPANDNNLFEAPPSSDTVIEYVNTLDTSARSGTYLQCKTVGFDRPRHHEEFVQSIQTFLTDRKNLATEARGKKKTLHLLIPNVRFTKLIIHHLRTKDNIHPRISSPLHYSHKESVLNTLRFVGKDGREVFGMPIPDALLTDEITSAPYYSRYLEHVAEYQRCLDEEHGKAEEEDVTESPKAAKATKSKAAKQTKPSAPKQTKPHKQHQQQLNPPRKTKVKSINWSRRHLMHHLPRNDLKLEPIYGDEEEDIQRAMELSIKEPAERTQGPARLVVIRHTPTTTEPSGHAESPSLYAELGLNDSEMEYDEEVSPEINVGTQDEGQAGPNPESQPQSSHVVHAGPNLEHMDFEVTNSSTQQNPEQMDEEFTTTAYPSVQENLKLPTEDQVILEEPASSAGTLYSLQNLDKELSFTNQFLVEKSQEDEPDKSNTEAEVQSMVTVPIPQDTSLVPLMTTPVIDLTLSQPVSTTIQAPLPTSTSIVTAITTTTSLLLPPPQP
ncbi:integrase, catalytic region, zinc finger, CCHC-type containing protein [Tanacetum coccineum]